MIDIYLGLKNKLNVTCLIQQLKIKNKRTKYQTKTKMKDKKKHEHK